MKIIKPNTTQVPNIIFDYWMDKLTPAEFKVLLCICRKTFGWHKDFDKISIRQIEKMTGLSRPAIVKSTESLVQIGLVTKHKFKDEFDGSDAPNQYEINVFIPDEINEENIGGSKLSLPGVVNSVNPPLVNSVNPQKKDITKERLTKEKSDPFFCEPNQHNIYYQAPMSEQSSDDLSSSSKAKQKATPPSEIAKDLASYFDKKLREVISLGKPTNLKTWSNQFDKIISEDGRTPECLKKCIDFVCLSHKDASIGFDWIVSTRCPLKLQSNYVGIEAMLNSPKKMKKISTFEELSRRGFTNGSIHNSAQCYLNQEKITFERGMRNESLLLKENGFLEQFDKLCRGFGINSKGKSDDKK